MSKLSSPALTPQIINSINNELMSLSQIPDDDEVDSQLAILTNYIRRAEIAWAKESTNNALAAIKIVAALSSRILIEHGCP